MINVLIAVHFLLAVGFNSIPESARTGASLLLLAGYLVVSIRGVLAGSRAISILMLATATVFVTWLVSIAAYDYSTWPPPTAEAATRGILPFVCGAAIIAARQKINSPALIVMSLAASTYAGFVALTGQEVTVGGIARPAFAASDLHTAAYISAGITIMLSAIETKEKLLRVIRYSAILISISLVLILQVRTAQVVVIVYFFTTFLVWIARNRHNRSILASALIATATAGTAALSLALTAQGDMLDSFSSGRIGNYLERFEILGGRGILEIIIGTGPGTDLIVTQSWWWDAKNSHSDIIQMIWEGGILSVISITIYFLVIYQLNRNAAVPIISAILASSAISNALITRPNAMFIVFCALAVLICKESEKLSDSVDDDLSVSRPSLGPKSPSVAATRLNA